MLGDALAVSGLVALCIQLLFNRGLRPDKASHHAWSTVLRCPWPRACSDIARVGPSALYGSRAQSFSRSAGRICRHKVQVGKTRFCRLTGVVGVRGHGEQGDARFL